MSKKRNKRNWKAMINPTATQNQSPIREWQIVLAELKEGTASVGVRFNKEDLVHFFLMHKLPTEAAQTVTDIAKGKITLKDIAGYDWKAVELPLDKETHQ